MSLPHTYNFGAIGARWAAQSDVAVTPTEKTTITRLTEEFDAMYSRFKPQSKVSQIAQQGRGSYIFPDSLIPLYETYVALERITEGQVNPLVGRSMEQLGYDPSYRLSLAGDTPVIPPSFVKTMTMSGTSLNVTEPALIDVGGVGRGLLVDTVATYLLSGHQEIIVDCDGDTFVSTNEPSTINLHHPRNPGMVIGDVKIARGGVSASTIHRREWGNGLHHIINARTGQPITTPVMATWAIADTALTADALSLALYFVTPQQLQDEFGAFHYVIINTDGSVLHNINDIGEIYS